MILPIQRVIFPGRMEKKSTKIKNIREKINNAGASGILSAIIGVIPVVKDVVAHRGMAKNGPIVR